MEDKPDKTIDFLRARLLAERSVSRTARQRAFELAKRVTELEKQLKFVSLQRKKAEKATTDVLAILESHGRNDLSEPSDSSSDQEEVSSDYKDGKHVEISEHVKVHESDLEGFSGSEVESSSVNGRSLSWKSSKSSSSRFLEKKFMDASRRRRSSFTSTGSSPRRVGKSCRKIRHREHKSAADVSQEGQMTSDGVRNSADVATKTSLKGLDIHEEKEPLAGPTSSRNKHVIQNLESERDMERAIEHQAQFIAQYEAEEKAQREWEDKFRENNGSMPDSCDPGTHSDITEERDESKAPAPPCSNDKLAPESQEIHTEPTNGGMNNNAESDNQNHPSELQGAPRNFSPAQGSVKAYEPALGTQENPDKLGSVLEALQQAKLSLKQNLDKFPLLENGPSVPAYRSEDSFSVPFSLAGLFRVPTDYEYGGTSTRANSLTYDPRLSLTNYPTEPSRGQFISSPYRESQSRSVASLDDRFHMVPTFPYVASLDDRFHMVPAFPYEQTLPEIPRQPPLGVGLSARDPQMGVRLPALNPRLEMGSPFLGDRYTPHSGAGVPSSSRYGTLSGTGMPRRTRSLYDGYTGPNTYE